MNVHTVMILLSMPKLSADPTMFIGNRVLATKTFNKLIITFLGISLFGFDLLYKNELGIKTMPI